MSAIFALADSKYCYATTKFSSINTSRNKIREIEKHQNTPHTVKTKGAFEGAVGAI